MFSGVQNGGDGLTVDITAAHDHTDAARRGYCLGQQCSYAQCAGRLNHDLHFVKQIAYGLDNRFFRDRAEIINQFLNQREGDLAQGFSACSVGDRLRVVDALQRTGPERPSGIVRE